MLLGSGSKEAAAADLAWTPERTYRFVWISGGEQRGESIVRFSEREIDGETRPLLSFHRKRSDRGHHTQTEGKLWLDAEGFPLSYREESRFSMASARPFRARQELRVEFRGDEVFAAYLNNANESQASKNTYELAPQTHLFATHALEHWIVFCSGLPSSPPETAGEGSPEASGSNPIGPGGETGSSGAKNGAEGGVGKPRIGPSPAPDRDPRGSRPNGEESSAEGPGGGDAKTASPADAPAEGRATRRLFFPEFGQTVELELTPRGPEDIRLGKASLSANRWDFEVAQWNFRGSIWVDDASRLLRYRSGPLEFVLDRPLSEAVADSPRGVGSPRDPSEKPSEESASDEPAPAGTEQR